MPLFAEVPDWVLFLATTLGGAFVWLATWAGNRRKEQRTEAKEDEKSIVDHQAATIARQGRELDNLTVRCDRQSELIGRLMAHMGYLEGILVAKGFEFQRFSPDGTSEFKTLKSETKP